MLRSLLALLLFTSCAISGSQTEAHSLLGPGLQRLYPSGEAQATLESRLDAARLEFESTGTEESAIWAGRYLGYLGRYQEAIKWYTQRLRDFPKSYRLLRHRGHRLISVREFEAAVEDLQRAFFLCRTLPDQVEPDGAPNPYGIPRGTTQGNILYHLALAEYLLGDYGAAAASWQECLQRCTNDDMRAATSNWLFHALRRSGEHARARQVALAVGADAGVIENTAYHKLLLVYSGRLQPGSLADDVDASTRYGVAAWRHENGNRETARRELQWIVDNCPWNAFGTLGAEADLARWR